MSKNFTIAILFLCFYLPLSSQLQSLAESVEYDINNNRFISSSNSASIILHDTLGNLSYLGQGLASSLGMEVIGNNLFCIVATSQTGPIKVIRVYDLTTETQVNSYTIPDAVVLNGMASDGISKIWVTDMQNSSIYEIDFTDILNPTHTKLAGSNLIPNWPNGVTYDEAQNRLVFVSWDDDKIRALDLSDNSIDVVLNNSGITNMDGIDIDAQNNFYVSSWQPNSRITKYSNDFSSSEVLAIPGILNPADICVAKELNILAIPSFQHNVIFHKLELTPTSTNDTHLESKILKIYPNPSTGIFNIEIPDENWEKADCQILNLTGQVVKNIKFENHGNNQFQIDLTQELRSGNYTIAITIDKKKTTSRILQIKL